MKTDYEVLAERYAKHRRVHPGVLACHLHDQVRASIQDMLAKGEYE